MFGLPFRRVWVLDTEYIPVSGAHLSPVCLTARELHSGERIQLWQDELPDRPPFPMTDDDLFVSYFAPAELGFFLALGWPLPTRVLDLFAEFRVIENRPGLPQGHHTLLNALSLFHVPGITKDQKRDTRDLILRGDPWSAGERREIIDYCQSDTDALIPLLERMLPHILMPDGRGLARALLRGRYMRAVAQMEHRGIPTDVEMLTLLREHWGGIKLDLIAAVDKDYGLYDGEHFKQGHFAAWLIDHDIRQWPRTESGRLATDSDTFRDMSRRYPILGPLKELRATLSEMRLEDLAVGRDGRNRAMLSPFRSVTGRNQPSNTKFLFGPATWIRGLIKPEVDQAVAYIDWSSQEVAIAAVLSGDQRLTNIVESGDPHLQFAKMAGLVPPHATKHSHKAGRDAAKSCVHGVNYGMGVRTLASRTGLPRIEAADLLDRYGASFPTFMEWARETTDVALLRGWTTTDFGWRMRTRDARYTTVRNWPVQSAAAEMLRLACSLMAERGIPLCAPVHDAVLVEGTADDIEDVVAEARLAMAEASAAVLRGMVIETDVEIIRWPDRYADERGAEMWQRVNECLDRAMIMNSAHNRRSE